jgi:hypothetical protein
MRKAAWLAPLTGVLFVVVAIVSIAISGGEPPDVSDASLQEIVDFYSDNKDAIQISSVLGALAGALLVFFGAHLSRVLRAAGDGDSHLPLVVFAGTIVIATGIAIDSTINFAIADAIDDIEPTSAQALLTLWNNDFLPLMMGMLLFLSGLGISVLRNGGLPKWIGWIAIVLAVISLTPIGFAAFIGGALLIVVISVVLTMRARTTNRATA